MTETSSILAIGNTLTRCTMTAGITVAAMHFNKPAILCWFILVALMDLTISGKE